MHISHTVPAVVVGVRVGVVMVVVVVVLELRVRMLARTLASPVAIRNPIRIRIIIPNPVVAALVVIVLAQRIVQWRAIDGVIVVVCVVARHLQPVLASKPIRKTKKKQEWEERVLVKSSE